MCIDNSKNDAIQTVCHYSVFQVDIKLDICITCTIKVTILMFFSYCPYVVMCFEVEETKHCSTR